MSMVEIPEELAGKLAEQATERGLTIDQLVAEILERQVEAESPLQAFKGSFESGDTAWASTDTAVLRKQSERSAVVD